jgi:hypothetical protein
MNRPTFRLGDSVPNHCRLSRSQYDLPVRAAGVVFYTFDTCTKRTVFLMVTRPNGTVETLCGKSDAVDRHIWHLITREIYEETNGVIRFSTSSSLFTTWAYFNKCCLFFVPVIEKGKSLGWNMPSTFGTHELGAGAGADGKKERAVQWMTIDQVNELKMIKYDQESFYYYCQCLHQRLVNLDHSNHTMSSIGDLFLIQTNNPLSRRIVF